MKLLNVFEVIILSSLIGSIIALTILIFKTILKDKLDSTFHYYIWFILLIKLIIPFGPQTPFNPSDIYDGFHVDSIINTSTQKSPVNPSTQLQHTSSDNTLPINDFQISKKSGIINDISLSFKNKANVEKTLFVIWILGVVLSLGILIIAHKKLREIVITSEENIDNTHKEILYTCVKDMKIKKEVVLLYSTKINSPALYGFIKPKVLIPIDVELNICNEDFKYILMHELTHLKNKDVFINWVLALLSTIYWFNPMLLYAFHKIRQDCESCCDSKVISYLDEGENLQYGSVLIKVLELGGKSNRLMGTTSMVMNSSEIKRRIIMISKYKRVNIKGILLGAVVTLIIGGLGIAINTSKVSLDKAIAKATPLQVDAAVTSSESLISNLSNGTVSTSGSINPIVPSLPEIVIYNSHADEDYPSGMKVTDVGALLNNKLINEGFSSNFIKCDPPADYIKAYQATHDLITTNIKEYSNAILLDIHRDFRQTTSDDTRKILFSLTKNSPHYEANKKFVDELLGSIKDSNQIKSDIFLYETGISYFNQDLSNNSALIDIGNNLSSDSDIEACVNALVTAIKSTYEPLLKK